MTATADTALMERDREQDLDEAVTIIDHNLTIAANRGLISSDEVSDMLLDLRRLIRPGVQEN